MRLCLLLLGLFITTNIWSLKKVAILDFINKEQNAQYAYLEESITESVTKTLKQKFSFKQLSKTQWKLVAEQNYMHELEYDSRSVGMNLGLLAKQDIVISGSYRVDASNKAKSAIILTQVRIFDINKRKIIADFVMKGPADSRIFDSINKISQRIAKEARSVLPNKGDWQQSDLKDKSPSKPLFTEPTLGLRAGYGFFQAGVADRIKPQPPYLSLNFKLTLVSLSNQLQTQTELAYLRQTPQAEENSALEDLRVDTTNILLGQFFLYQIPFGKNFYVSPTVGMGFIYQANSVTGNVEASVALTIGYVGLGSDFGYILNKQLDLIVQIRSILEIEKSTQTFLHSASLGVDYKI